MNTMYCEKCQSYVLTKREDLDIGVVILLFIFTAGLGVLIYLMIYYDKETNRCIHCNSICNPMILEYQKDKRIPPVEEKSEKMLNYISLNTIENKSKFCYNCGTELDKREGRFCPFCGVNVE